MARSSIVGSAALSLFPSMKGMKAAISREAGGAVDSTSKQMTSKMDAAGRASGGRFSASLKKSVGQSSKGLADALSRDVAAASKALSNARLREADAAGTVRVAEARLSALRKQGVDSTMPRYIAAEERLAKVTRGLGSAQNATRAATGRLRESQGLLAASTRTAAQTMGSPIFRTIGATLSNSWAAGMRGIRAVTESTMAGIRGLATSTGAALGATLTAALIGGVGRLQSLENAAARMRGLGLESETVAKVLDQANKAAQGTAFGFDELAAAASMAVTAGLEAGPELEGYLDAIKGAATASGSAVSEIGTIFGKVRTEGRAYTTEIRQLADRQIPIWKALGEEIGVSTDAVRKLATDGKISAEQFEAAVRRATGGMAEEMGKTTGSLARNTLAALKRLGVAMTGTKLEGDKLVGGLYPTFGSFFSMVTAGLDALTAVVAPFAEKVFTPLGEKLTKAFDKATEAFKKFKDEYKFDSEQWGWVKDLAKDLGPFLGALTPLFAALVAAGLGPLVALIPGLGAALGALAGPFGLIAGLIISLTATSPELQQAFKDVGAALGESFGKVAEALAPVLPVLGDAVGVLAKALSGVLVSALESMIPLIEVFADVIADLAPVLADILPSLADALGEGLGFVADVLKRLGPALKPIAGALGKALVKIFQALAPVIEKVGPAISDLFDAFLPFMDEIMAAFAPLAEPLLNVFLELIDALIPLIPLILDLVKAFLPLLGPILKLVEIALPPLIELLTAFLVPALELVSSGIEAVTPILEGLLTTLGGVAKIIIGAFTMDPEMIAEGMGQAFEGGKMTVDGFVGYFETAVDEIPGFFEGVNANIGAVLVKNAAKLVPSGIEMMKKFAEGITQGQTFVSTAITKAMLGIASFFPHSPAKRGPFSGSGWTAVGSAGAAIMEEFAAGANTWSGSLALPTPAELTADVRGRSAAQAKTVSTGAASAASVQMIINAERGVDAVTMGEAAADRLVNATRRVGV